jgi:hypothetical protein
MSDIRRGAIEAAFATRCRAGRFHADFEAADISAKGPAAELDALESNSSERSEQTEQIPTNFSKSSIREKFVGKRGFHSLRSLPMSRREFFKMVKKQ